MREIYIFADETGDLGYTNSSSAYFGFGTLTIEENFADSLWDGFRLRCELERQGHDLKGGFHAKVDKYSIKKEMFELISQLDLQFDFTFLNKANAIPSVKSRGELYLYKLAWYLHFKHLVKEYINEEVRLVVVIADIQTNAKKRDLRAALHDVNDQFPHIKTALLIWSSQSSWGLQLADYGLWAAQRNLVQGRCEFWDGHVSKLTRSNFKPWG